MSLMILSVFVLMFLFPNALWFSISLVILTLTVLANLSSLNLVPALISFIFVLVYLGAIIIVISYICAIVPNSLLTPRVSGLTVVLILSLIAIIFSMSFMPNLYLSPLNSSFNVLALLFNSQYLLAFFTVAVILFFILLIVTTQYLAPNGPFRSVGL